jgi:hypothetical protein
MKITAHIIAIEEESRRRHVKERIDQLSFSPLEASKSCWIPLPPDAKVELGDEVEIRIKKSC